MADTPITDSPNPPPNSIEDDLASLNIAGNDETADAPASDTPEIAVEETPEPAAEETVEESVREEKEEKDENTPDDEEMMKKSKTVMVTYPVRPGAEVCSFYMKTGNCKFGTSCKFNHPPLRKFPQGGKAKGKDESFETATQNVKENDDYSFEREVRVNCKYFDRPGGCKFGKACKFNHSKKASPASELNFMGLPIRPGEKECPYYMRNGSCKFGAHCRFNHPEPTSGGGHDDLPSYGNGEPISSPDASRSTPKSWSPPAPVNENPAYLPLMFARTQARPAQPEWTAYQAPIYSPGTIPMAPTYAMYNQPSERNIFSHQGEPIDEFPERPGQPECSFFLKTGNCKYKSSCKFHHPKNVLEKSSACSLSELGLPLRPGENICSYYSRYGICKYGPACKYDHPINHAPSSVDITPGFGNPMINNHVMAAGS
ncbi:zinc finger CCCH domain-containing protein 43 [Silene latifolia]|uniref:zinc finger CCCH domain-containing protein 43 n=1 Tax=Silene latifolia TaxID=37657 RepID=UPI003D77DD81